MKQSRNGNAPFLVCSSVVWGFRALGVRHGSGGQTSKCRNCWHSGVVHVRVRRDVAKATRSSIRRR